jgi:hypothetical protein
VTLGPKDKLLEKFRDMAVSRGGACWFKPNDAIGVVEETRAHRVPILGIDSATIGSDWVVPSHFVDYSAMSSPPVDIYNHAIGYLRGHSSEDIYFEIVLGESVEGKQ